MSRARNIKLPFYALLAFLSPISATNWVAPASYAEHVSERHQIPYQLTTRVHEKLTHYRLFRPKVYALITLGQINNFKLGLVLGLMQKNYLYLLEASKLRGQLAKYASQGHPFICYPLCYSVTNTNVQAENVIILSTVLFSGFRREE